MRFNEHQKSSENTWLSIIFDAVFNEICAKYQIFDDFFEHTQSNIASIK